MTGIKVVEVLQEERILLREIFLIERFCVASLLGMRMQFVYRRLGIGFVRNVDTVCFVPVCSASIERIRACASRLRSAARSALPAVATPGFSNEPPHDDDHLGEGVGKSMSGPRRWVHHTSFLWALFQEFVRSTTHRFVACKGAGLPF